MEASFSVPRRVVMPGCRLFGLRWARTGLPCVLLVLTAWQEPAHAAHVEEPLGYRIGPCAGTQDKPQSKLWFNDDSYWGIFDTPDGTRILELVNRRWQPVAGSTAVLGGHDGRADVVWDGRRLHVLLFAKLPQLFEYSYRDADRTWLLEPDSPVPLPIPEGSETMVVDQDSRGRLWATYLTGGRVYVTHSAADHGSWDLPGRVLQDGVGKDDISSLLAFGGDRIGVMWTDQQRDEFGFRVHRDADPDSVWGNIESVDPGDGHADDHLHLCTDTAGRVYAVTKDDTHCLNAHLRSPEGVWVSHEDLLDRGHATRPILMTAPEDSLIILLYTRWHEGEEVISCRTARMGTLDFGPPFTFIAEPGISMNDVTGLRQPLPRGSVVAVATGEGEAWWNGWGVPRQDHGAEPLPLRAEPLPLCKDAVLALALDEPGGPEVIDASPREARGHLGGPWAEDACEPHRVDGVSGRALRFDGVRDFVEVKVDTLLWRDGSCTVEAWVRRASHDTKDAVLCKGTPGGRSVEIRLLKSDTVEFLREDRTGKNHELEGRQVLADSVWHHLACVYDHDHGKSSIYVDGRLDTTAPDSLDTAVNEDPLVIGARFGEKDVRDHFHGDIDQVCIYPFARYDADFTPRKRFECDELVGVFLDWTPRFAGLAMPTGFTVLRRRGDGPEERVTTDPLRETNWIDDPGCTCHVTYRVVPEGGGQPASTVEIDWPPAGVVGVPHSPR